MKLYEYQAKKIFQDKSMRVTHGTVCATENDPDIHLIVMVGEIGGTDEERTAEYIREKCSKPYVTYLTGISAPPDQPMGHAGAIVSHGKGSFQSRIEAFTKAGIPVAKYPREVKDIALELLK